MRFSFTNRPTDTWGLIILNLLQQQEIYCMYKDKHVSLAPKITTFIFCKAIRKS